ncbi:MAG: hypothetical protein NC452_13705, partial [Eubacterium sp.]|nr:hypothetical protein [Eubacterium sp.]
PEDKELWEYEKVYYLDEQGFLLIKALKNAMIENNQDKYPYNEILSQILSLLQRDFKSQKQLIAWHNIWGKIYDFQKTLQVDELPEKAEDLEKMGLYERYGIKGAKVYLNKDLLEELNKAATGS